jgi:TonB family protein
MADRIISDPATETNRMPDTSDDTAGCPVTDEYRNDHSTCKKPLLPEKRIIFTSNGDIKSFHRDWLFPLILIATVTFSIGGGLFLSRIPPLKKVVTTTVRKIKTEFSFTETRKPVPPPEPIIHKTEKKPVPEPLDLTNDAQIVKEAPEDPLPQKQPEPRRKKVRKVFGLRKVYSTGLGAGGSMSDAVVGKIGNTINKAYDTVTATTTDIKGTVVSTVTVTSAPRFRKRVKPVYSQEMIDNKVQGTVKVKVLVDIDGKVKKATCLNDIGYDSVGQAVKATMKMEFDPAMRGSDPVAVWIIVPIRFVLLG